MSATKMQQILHESHWSAAEFLRLEYTSLREEVRETKNRIFRLAGLGIVGMPSAYFLANSYKLEVLIISLPLLICTVVLLYLSESLALMRCGMYIRTKIETSIKSDGTAVGWESWLEEDVRGATDRRSVDKMVALFFCLLFLFYYIASVALAVQVSTARFGIVGMAVALGTYIAVGIVFLATMVLKYRECTSTD